MDESRKALYRARAKVLKALAHPTRLWMVEKLAQGEHCVCELLETVDADFSTVSKHLSVLRQAGIVDVQKRGKQMFYRLKVPCVLEFMGCIEAVLAAGAQDRPDAPGMTTPGTACRQCRQREKEL